MMRSYYPVIVIGAGQAGLAMGYKLKSAGIDYIILGKEQRLGDVWRQRYDSLLLFTPRWMSRLPGYAAGSCSDLNGYADKNEIADDLEAYGVDHQLNVRLDTEVKTLKRNSGEFTLETNQGSFSAARVVVATGPFQNPSVPDFSDHFSSDVFQVHTARYKNHEQLREGKVLIVGCGNSGAQIAEELAGHREVHVSTSRPIKCLPQEVLGKSIFWWFHKLGVYKASINSRIGKSLSQRGDPVIGKGLKTCIESGKVTLHPRAIMAGKDYVLFEDGDSLKVDNVIWATGFGSDYGWLQVPDVLDPQGRPRHMRGVCKARGVYFLGLPWQHNRGSALIGGVAADAEYLLQNILADARKEKAFLKLA